MKSVPSKAQKKRIADELESHGMLWETGHCLCGVDCHGSADEADTHFTHVAFELGYNEGRASVV